MCHLTATQQFQLADVDIDGYMQQAEEVLRYYRTQNRPAKVIHFNFMARGEALNNSHLIKKGDYSVLEALAKLSWSHNLHPRFNISTIMPKAFADVDLIDHFPIIYPDFYYSIYSVNQEFRKEWMRNAQPVDAALLKLYRWQEITKKIVKLHFAMISGENDSTDDITALCKTIKASGLKTDINIVRYNPHSEEYGEESSEKIFNKNLTLMEELLPCNTKVDIIPRVGYDCFASCGMFSQ
jgi:adenine C2-methylase RlmN of 23S rRNA A2503 and tRNA A37